MNAFTGTLIQLYTGYRITLSKEYSHIIFIVAPYICSLFEVVFIIAQSLSKLIVVAVVQSGDILPGVMGVVVGLDL